MNGYDISLEMVFSYVIGYIFDLRCVAYLRLDIAMPTVTTPADIGSAIAAARKSRRLTQKKVADIAGTSQAIVSQIEAGKPTAQLAIVLGIIVAVGLRIDLSDAAGTAGDQAAPAPRRPASVIFDEPLPDSSIDLDAIVGDSKPGSAK